LGDLTSVEIVKIQNVVDTLNREIVVVGSAARGERRNLDKKVEIGYRPGQRSDIDYKLPTRCELEKALASAFLQENIAVYVRLPDVDWYQHGVHVGICYESGPRIWFRPFTKPQYIEKNEMGLEAMQWTPECTMQVEL
jgi:hypothetical protein